MRRSQSRARRQVAFMEEAQRMYEQLEDWYDKHPQASFGESNCSRKIWLKQERQDRRSHQPHQILKGVLAVAFSGVQDGG